MTKEELREKRNRTIETLNDIKAVLGLDELYIDELEKENAELKKKYEKMFTIAHNRGMFVISAMRENRIFEDQLTKAKEIIKDLLSLSEGETDSKLVFTRAEQFLSEVEK